MNTKLKLENLNAECLDCANQSFDYKLSDFMYGSRLFYTEDQKMVYGNLAEDSTAAQVSKFIDDNLPNNTDSEKNDFFSKIFCKTCDPVQEKIITDNKKLICKSCGGSNIKVTYQNPPTYTEFILPTISHDVWNKKNPEEQHKELSNLLKLTEKRYEIRYFLTQNTNLNQGH